MQAVDRGRVGLVALVSALLLAACGGGGGSGGDGAAVVATPRGGASGSDSGSAPGSGSGGEVTVTPAPSVDPPPPPPWTFTIAPVAQRGLRLDWTPVPGAAAYRIDLDADAFDGADDFSPVQTIDGGASVSHTFTDLRLVDALRHRYRMRACVAADCSTAATTGVVGTLHEAADVIQGANLSDGSGFGRVMSTARGAVATSEVGIHWLAVGAPVDGKVLIYQRAPAGGPWSLVQSLSGAAGRWDFGASVSLSPSGLWLAVGVPGDGQDGAGINPRSSGSLRDSGAARVYRRVSPSPGAYQWELVATVKAFNPGIGDGFGSAVGINDDGYLVVGAPFEDSAASGSFPANADSSVFADAPSSESQDAGAVYLYRFFSNPAVPNRALSYLKPQAGSAAAANGARFGSSLSWSLRRLAVGAPRASSPTSQAGMVQTFGFNFSTQALQYENSISPDPGEGPFESSDWGFGASLSNNADGSLLAIGFPDRSGGQTKSGAVYVYEHVDGGGVVGTWILQQSFASPTPAPFDRFGMSVHLMSFSVPRPPQVPLQRAQLLIGSWGDSARHVGLQRSGALSVSPEVGSHRDTGAAFYYERPAEAQWMLKARMKAPTVDIDQHMGRAVVMTQDGSELLIGAEHGNAVIGY